MVASVEPDVNQKSFAITFVHNPDIRYDQNYGAYFAPLWAYTLASHVPHDWSVTTCDCKIDNIHEVDRSDVFAFSGINQATDSIRKAHGLVKEKHPDSTSILGGPITWSLREEGKLSYLEYVDYIFSWTGKKHYLCF